jgi:hypothetical protein
MNTHVARNNEVRAEMDKISEKHISASRAIISKVSKFMIWYSKIEVANTAGVKSFNPSTEGRHRQPAKATGCLKH